MDKTMVKISEVKESLVATREEIVANMRSHIESMAVLDPETRIVVANEIERYAREVFANAAARFESGLSSKITGGGA